jgi:hypothetical protein
MPSPRRATAMVEREDATRCALAAVLVTSGTHRTACPPNARLHAVLTRNADSASLGRRDQCAASIVALPQRRGFADEPGVQPALNGVKWRWMVLVTGTAARAQRVASARNASGCFRAPLLAAPRWCAVQGLFFGDFLLAPQKKVTPPPGGTPGNATSRRQPYEKACGQRWGSLRSPQPTR